MTQRRVLGVALLASVLAAVWFLLAKADLDAKWKTIALVACLFAMQPGFDMLRSTSAKDTE